MKKASEIVEGFSKKYTFDERKQMGVEAVDKVIKQLMMGQHYDGIQIRFDALNKLKQEIKEL